MPTPGTVRAVVSALALVVLCLLAAASPAAAAVQRDVAFARPGGVPLRMDVHLPAERPAAGAPVVVWIHGGGFWSGDRSRLTPYARAFAARGWVAATIDYRLLPHTVVQRDGWSVGVPGAVADARAAVRFLRRNAERFGLDPERVAVAGVSAGAITALHLAARASGADRIQAAVAISGFGPPEGLGAGDPPALLLHGTADPVVRLRRATGTCARAREQGGRCTLVRFPGVRHDLATVARPAVVERVSGWLGRRLGHPGAV